MTGSSPASSREKKKDHEIAGLASDIWKSEMKCSQA